MTSFVEEAQSIDILAEVTDSEVYAEAKEITPPDITPILILRAPDI